MALDDIVFDPTETGLFEIPIVGNTYTLTGQIVDAGSSPVSGAIVKAFLTGNDRFIGQATSNSTGGYSISTGYFQNHYIVAYLDSTTDLAGTTVNNLMPTP